MKVKVTTNPIYSACLNAYEYSLAGSKVQWRVVTSIQSVSSQCLEDGPRWRIYLWRSIYLLKLNTSMQKVSEQCPIAMKGFEKMVVRDVTEIALIVTFGRRNEGQLEHAHYLRCIEYYVCLELFHRLFNILFPSFMCTFPCKIADCQHEKLTFETCFQTHTHPTFKVIAQKAENGWLLDS